jgi:hypothetical protein
LMGVPFQRRKSILQRDLMGLKWFDDSFDGAQYICCPGSTTVKSDCNTPCETSIQILSWVKHSEVELLVSS